MFGHISFIRLMILVFFFILFFGLLFSQASRGIASSILIMRLKSCMLSVICDDLRITILLEKKLLEIVKSSCTQQNYMCVRSDTYSGATSKVQAI